MCLHAFQLISISPALLVSEWLQTATLVVFPLSGRADRPLSDLACERCWSEGTILTWQTPSDETHTEPRQEKCSPIPRGCSADGGLWKRDVKKTHRTSRPFNDPASRASLVRNELLALDRRTKYSYLFVFDDSFCKSAMDNGKGGRVLVFEVSRCVSSPTGLHSVILSLQFCNLAPKWRQSQY